MPDSELISDEQDPIPTPELKIKGIREEIDNLEVIFLPERTYLVLIAIHNDENKNVIGKISCKKGIAIGGYVYDTTSDCYVVSCSEYIALGYIPLSMGLRMKTISNWQIRLPMAEGVIKKFLTLQQKREIKHFKSLYKAEEYNLQFMQIVEPF